MVVMSINVTGGKAVIDKLTAVSIRMSDARPAFDVIEQMFYSIEMKQFFSEGESGGTPWEPLNSDYLAWKLSHGFDASPMMRTMSLYESLTGSGGQYAINEKTPDSLRLGTTHPGAWPAQTGSEFEPARPLIALTDQHRLDMFEILRKWISSGF
jgi:hypothetical protein